ncbi:MAG: tryptophan synthase subunit alpha [Leptospiraceae bacterium]|nr:tryptophan synthase subunit alpha [Leptospiraceae bacterium]
MGSLKECFENKKNRSNFIPYISLGDPEYALSVEWAKALIDGGADILELGIPFSDPTADGPVIQKSYMRALAKGFSMDKVLETTKQIHAYKPNIPLVYLTYLNPVISYGEEKFFKKAYLAGIRGIVIPDLPVDAKDSAYVLEKARASEIDIIHLITPASSKERIEQIKKVASGFIYYVTSYGVTGERANFAQDLKMRIEMVRKSLKLPICAGFGISTPEQAKSISAYSDGIIIGSAIQRIIEEKSSHVDACAKALHEYAKEIARAVH